MKYIILAAGKGTDSFSEEDNLPKCLLKIDNRTVIDNILNISKSVNISDINLIGGFEILKIMKSYPNLKYFYNEKWESTKSLFSFFKSFTVLNNDSLISYSDIFHKSETVKCIDRNKINIFYDSRWNTRYENRDILNLEKVFGRQRDVLGEFSGLLYIPKCEIDYIKNKTEEILENNQNDTLLTLVNEIILEKEVNLIDVQGNWAELDSIQDIEHFMFGTKAETLYSLKNKVKKSKILDQYTFTVDEYITNKNLIVSTIQSRLSSNLLVIRSSALNEDNHNSSMAGNYESVLQVKRDDTRALENAIDRVIESYTKNDQLQNGHNQVLVQPYLKGVTVSGVVFSKDLQTASPYYIVNYDESDDTQSVTSGSGNNLNTFICYNRYETKIEKKELQLLIEAVKEIESITKYDAIDIEFAFVGNTLFILQVRPIAAKKDSIKVSSSDVSFEIKNIKLFMKKSSVDLLSDKKAYGVMPDWNPAEIIGINPKPLSFDLYRYLITDTIWAKSRKILGYKDVKNSAGLVSLGGKPYVDISMSFNTFIPDSLDDNIAVKLIDYFIEKLKKNSHNHDKVEFDIAITSFDFNFDKKLEELSLNGFNGSELSQIEKSYKLLTEDMILQKSISIEDELAKTLSLSKKRKIVLNSDLDEIDKIYLLLEDCKQYGTLPFSNLARFAFIGSIFLKSLLEKKVIDKDEYDAFFKSIHTVAKSFVYDFNSLISKKLSKDKFLELYGHLRPGTYDITSKSYAEGFDDYIDINYGVLKNEVTTKFRLSKKTRDKISYEIKKNGLNFSVAELIDFIIKATEAREKAKFEFTKNINSVLELISEIGKDYDLDRDDLSYLNLYEIIKYKNSSDRIDFENSIKYNISKNRQKYLITSAIKLPELIFDIKDVDMFYYPSMKPNFITQHKIDGSVIELKDNGQTDIEGKIVFIQSADPGYDWIFSHKIKALVTKYGGAASHMAIRCAEFDLPAAIGCGDKIYDDLCRYGSITIDCANETIKGIA